MYIKLHHANRVLKFYLKIKKKTALNLIQSISCDVLGPCTTWENMHIIPLIVQNIMCVVKGLELVIVLSDRRLLDTMVSNDLKPAFWDEQICPLILYAVSQGGILCPGHISCVQYCPDQHTLQWILHFD